MCNRCGRAGIFLLRGPIERERERVRTSGCARFGAKVPGTCESGRKRLFICGETDTEAD